MKGERDGGRKGGRERWEGGRGESEDKMERKGGEGGGSSVTLRS